MANIRTLKLNLLADVSNFNKELGGVQGKLKGFQNSLKQAGQVSTIALGGLAAAGYTAVRAAEEVAVANSRLDNILTSMGYADATKRVTDYAQALEVTTAVDAEVIKLTQVVPFLLEDELIKHGAIYSKGADWSSHTQQDGLLITGQNPASSEAIAKLLLASLQEKK
jgi:putative intracellular protease/amidase